MRKTKQAMVGVGAVQGTVILKVNGEVVTAPGSGAVELACQLIQAAADSGMTQKQIDECTVEWCAANPV